MFVWDVVSGVNSYIVECFSHAPGQDYVPFNMENFKIFFMDIIRNLRLRKITAQISSGQSLSKI